ncbi:hypothetical protein J5N97_024502 [Dioscorea zingiberensis]|uniref:Cupin type-1 domain-containing protein n=1 Tax=Dioscorea zingiberensis TaxID=325984 RepID=A0A9D5C7H4_9LILI|nr:hypothetical protein J5N97_024502 [Dioscorea zingiberensis]
MATKRLSLLLLLLLSLLFVSRCAAESECDPEELQHLREARQCRLKQLSASRPSRRIESEGGVTEYWDDTEDQFQCAGVSVRRHIIQPGSITALTFENSPSLFYVQQGRAVFGLTFPGCPETFSSGDSSRSSFEEAGRSQLERDTHQKVQRIQQGDIVAIVPGAVHWCFNDGDQQLVITSIFDLNNQLNQLEPSLRTFQLSGSIQEQSRFSEQEQFGYEQEERRPNRWNLVSALDSQMLSEVLNIPLDTVKQIQRPDTRGHILTMDQQQQQTMFRPEVYEREQERRDQEAINGIDETFCFARVQYNLDRRGEADVFSSQAGRLNSVNANKLPILKLIDMSAEKGNLRPGAIFSPHWSMNAHTVVLVTRGEGRLQVVDDRGWNVFNGRVRQGEIIVIPQHYVSMNKAGSNGIEWVAFKTSGMPMSSQLSGRSSMISGTPVQVLANSFRISIGQARQLKQCRRQHFLLFPPASSAAAGSC